MAEWPTNAEEIRSNTAFLAEEGVAVIMVCIPHPDGTATLNMHGPVDGRTRALIEAACGPALTSSLLTVEAALAHGLMGDIPTVVMHDG